MAIHMQLLWGPETPSFWRTNIYLTKLIDKLYIHLQHEIFEFTTHLLKAAQVEVYSLTKKKKVEVYS